MLEVDEHRIGRRNLHQPVDRRLRQDHWEDAVLDGIARKNVRIGRRDDDADAKIAKRPRRMFTARPATEIVARDQNRRALRSEEHTSELQSLMRISYAVFCLKKKKTLKKEKKHTHTENKNN